MKRILLVILVCFTLVFSGGSAMALYLDDNTKVGEFDKWLAGDSLGNSSDAEEIAWVNTELKKLGLMFSGDEYTKDDYYKDEGMADNWFNVYEYENDEDYLDNVYAYSLVTSPPPEFYLLKLGGGNYTGVTHNLYENLAQLEWAVIDLGALWGDATIDITRISHVSEFGEGTAPVPEPATMLLFGTGLIGLAGLRARKKN